MAVDDSNRSHRVLKELLTPYCFGDATEDERLAFEAHLLECDNCWAEVQRLDAAVQTLRTDGTLLNKFITPSTFRFFGLSGTVGRILDGHLWHPLLGCFLYALLFTVSLVFECLDLGQLSTRAWWIAGLVVLPWMFGTSLFALFVDWKLTLQEKTSGLIATIGIFIFSLIVLLVGTYLFFPEQPGANLNAKGYPPQIAYIKDTMYYYLPVGLFYLLLPFHFVVAVQNALRLGRYRPMFALLSKDRAGIPPRGAVFPKVWLLSAVLVALGLFIVIATNTLFDRLAPSPHRSLFMLLIQIKNFILFTLGVECLIWYSRSLDELKRECLAVLKDLRPMVS